MFSLKKQIAQKDDLIQKHIYKIFDTAAISTLLLNSAPNFYLYLSSKAYTALNHN